MFDTPVAPVYFAVVFLIHPHLGFIVLGSGAALVIVALLNQRVTAAPFNQANSYGARANMASSSTRRPMAWRSSGGWRRSTRRYWQRSNRQALHRSGSGATCPASRTGRPMENTRSRRSAARRNLPRRQAPGWEGVRTMVTTSRNDRHLFSGRIACRWILHHASGAEHFVSAAE